MAFSELYPAKSLGEQSYKPVRRAFSASDALIGISFESLVLVQFANALATGAALTGADHTRLRLSATRIQRAQESTQ